MIRSLITIRPNKRNKNKSEENMSEVRLCLSHLGDHTTSTLQAVLFFVIEISTPLMYIEPYIYIFHVRM